MRPYLKCLALILCAALLPSAHCVAEETPSVAYALKETTLSGAPGATIKLEISGAVTPGFHTYTSKTAKDYGDDQIPLAPTEFVVEPATLLSLDGKVTYPAPKLMKDKDISEQPIEIFEDTAAFMIPVKISADAKPGEYPVKLTVNYQICKRQCFQGTKELQFTLKVTGGGGLSGLSGLTFGKKPPASANKKVEWSLQEKTFSVARGQTIKVDVAGAIPEGFHVYSTKTVAEYGADVVLTPTTFEIEPAAQLKLNGKATNSPPEMIKDPFGSGVMIETFEKTVTFSVPVQVSKDAKPGEIAATLTVNAQMCNAKNCVPINASLPFTLKITDAAAVNEAPADTKPVVLPPQMAKASSDIEKARKQGLGAYLLLALVAGATALLTPCVFPMIPITVSFFTKRKHISRQRSIRDAFVYSMGIIFTFTGLGFAFALLLGASGISDFATNPWVNIGVATVFIALAGSLFGWYEIQLPTGVLNKLNSKANEGQGITSVLLMGLVFSLTSFTCTVPFVGGVMVAATQGDWLWPLLGMMVFSTVFSMPFFLLALFPAALKSLPKSGGWLNSVKVVMGFLEVAAAMKFLSNADIVWQWALLTRNVFLVIWIALSVLTALYLLGKIRFSHDTPLQRMSGLRMITAAGFASAGLFLTSGMFGWVKLGVLEAYVPAPGYASSGDWIEDYNAALEKAKKTGMPIFVDFTGYTCVNCRRMEEDMFPRAEIAPLLEKFVRVRLHTDGRKDEQQIRQNRANRDMQLKRFDTTALPFYAIIAPDDAEIEKFNDGYTTDVNAFVSFLKRGLDSNARAGAAKPSTADPVVQK